jgi:hypothetical protein
MVIFTYIRTKVGNTKTSEPGTCVVATLRVVAPLEQKSKTLGLWYLIVLHWMGVDKTNEETSSIVGRKLTDQADNVPLGEEDDSFVVEGIVDDFESDENMDDSDDNSIGSYQRGGEGEDSSRYE